MRRSKSVRLFDFSGGLNTTSPVTSLEMNQAIDLQNINLLPNGGFEKRRGNTEFNSTAMASGAAVSGMGYYRQADGDEWLMAACGTKLFKSEFDGTMDDITGAVTITTGGNNTWTHTVMNDLSIWVGGAPDAPIKWSGTGNAAVLGGSPPSGNFGLTGNNRFFIGNTTANPSRIAWSILGNPEDWSGTGSGTQDISANDGDTLVGAAQLGIDHIICFKQNSIHDLVIRNAPFPVFPIRRGSNIGAVSKRAIVPVGDLIYYITPEPRMKATDGTKIVNFPDILDKTWDSLNKSRLKYIQGLYYPHLDQIWWFCSSTSASTHDTCLIWDLSRKAWLRHTTGFKMNAAVLAQDRVAYTGSYAGKLYLQDAASTYTDASETSSAINAYFRSGWMDFGDSMQRKTIPLADLNFVTQTTGSFDFLCGFDFVADRVSKSINMIGVGDLYGTGIYGSATFGGQTDRTSMQHILGSGKFFQYLVRNQNASQPFSFNGLSLAVKMDETLALR